ncbi:protein msta-like [Copidosoma floridanum]|uniref:protein msta-like n=1 Tax=Copidosoma floridanum TaxID=29053 RepID=UPI0006C9E50E|nr:protein msta-like [Copidosoma floridanum]
MDEDTCAVCKISAKQKCGGCRSVFYCSRDHQKQHWKEHSRSCRAYKMMETEAVGRHYIAQRRIEAGEVVIREEEPLLLSPPLDTQAICLGCYVALSPETSRPCRDCGWPLCLTCNSHGPECGFTQRYRTSKVSVTEFGLTHPKYRCIGALRALCLRESDPKAYAALARLQAFAGRGDADFHEPRETARFVKRFFDRLAEDIDEQEIARIVGIIQINGHEVPTVEPNTLVAVYDLSSYLEHSCRANCSKSFTDSNGIVVRAAEPIEKGAHVTICYTDPLWGTANRRHHLLRTKFFECACPRCSDPTEFGTMFNAIKCRKSDCGGYMLPPTFLTPEVPDYECDKCGDSVSSNEVDEELERMGRDLAGMRKNDPETCRAFARRHGSALHANHFYMTDVKLALAQLIGQQVGGLPTLPDETVSEKILLCKNIDELLRVIVPSENRVRGLVLFEMHAAVAEFGRRRDKEQLYNILLEAKRLLSEAYRLLKHEPESLPEGKIAQTAKKNLGEIELILRRLCLNSVATP